jgi:hypothetical protein
MTVGETMKAPYQHPWPAGQLMRHHRIWPGVPVAAMDQVRSEVTHDARQPEGNTQVVARPIEHADRHVAHDPIRHLAALIKATDRLLELRRGQTVEQIYDAVLKPAARQPMHNLQDAQR